MNSRLEVSQQNSQDAFCYDRTNQYGVLKDMILDWLEEYRQLEPLLEKMAGRVSTEKLEATVNLLERFAEDRSNSGRSQI